MVNAIYGVRKISYQNQYVKSSPSSQQAFHGARQLAHMADQTVGLEVRDRNIGIAEFNADHRDAGARHGLLQDGWVWFCDAKRIGSADRGESRTQSKLVEQEFRQPFQFVGA